MTTSDPMPSDVAGSRRRARGEVTRTKSVRVRLTPDEATVIGEAAARASMSVGAWVGDTAVGRARAEAAVDAPDEATPAGLLSWRQLVAALVALRAEVAAVRREPIVEFDSAPRADEPPDGRPCSSAAFRSHQAGVVEVLRRIDAVTAVAVDATSSAAQRSSLEERSARS